MGTISAEKVKELREATQAGMMDCKKALSESGGDFEKAVDLLRKKGLSKAAKRSGRQTAEGLVYSYIHPGGKLGVLIEVGCETDFVANSDEFQEFVKNLAMQVAAANPFGIVKEDIPADVIEREKEIYISQARETGKPENILEKIAEGKMSKFYKESCLISQSYIRDPNITIEDLLNQIKAKVGENIDIKRFVRFEIGK